MRRRRWRSTARRDPDPGLHHALPADRLCEQHGRRCSIINPEMEEAVRILGGSRLTALRRVVVPLLKRSLLGAWLLVFIPATRELSSAIFLYGPETRSSVMIFDMSEEGNFEVLSALGRILQVITLAFVWIGHGADRSRLHAAPGGANNACPSSSCATFRAASAASTPSTTSTWRCRRASSSPCSAPRAAARPRPCA